MHVNRTVAIIFSLFSTVGQAAEDLGFLVPDGFEVSLFAEDSLAHDIFSMTTDSQGRIVVAGKGYIKTLSDTDQDGRADQATLFSNFPKSGAHGMCFDGPNVVVTGDNGVWKLTDADGDGKADGPPERWATLGNLDHGANGIVRGPDGWFYLICGNDAGVSTVDVKLPGSPVKQPYCGAVVRFSPDGKTSDVYAHGFRNPYDLTIGPNGHLFTVDADGERDHHLPWYTPNRLFDIAQGMEHGWLINGWKRSWNRPEWFYDNVDRLVEIGRGSPTGVEIYRHSQFPAKYQQGVFSICWTFGRIYFHHLQPKGSSFTGKREIFMQTTGNIGFAPVDLVVDPQGDLYVAIGGRGTQGGIFRVRYTGASSKRPRSKNGVDQVLRAPQPLASWSRVVWKPKAMQLGQEVFEQALLDSKRPTAERVRAVEILTELFGGLSPRMINQFWNVRDPSVVARLAWALSRGKDSNLARRWLAFFTFSDSPLGPTRRVESHCRLAVCLGVSQPPLGTRR